MDVADDLPDAGARPVAEPSAGARPPDRSGRVAGVRDRARDRWVERSAPPARRLASPPLAGPDRRRGIVRRGIEVPGWRRRLLAEAAVELVRASLVLAVTPRSRTVDLLGAVRPDGKAADVPRTGGPGGERTAIEVGRAVAATSALLPWRPTCLRQALAGQRMLRRRAIDGAIHLGVVDARLRTAHAWLQVGDRIVLGGRGARGFTTVGAFGGDRIRRS